MNTAVTTREFVIDDYEHACALWSQVEGVEICRGDSRAELARFLARNPALSRVAEVDGEFAGVALCGHDGRRGFIYHLAIAPAQRGRGLGQLIIGECERGLHEAGIRRAIILVAHDNRSGHEFWLRAGWEDLDATAMSRDIGD